MDLNKVSLIGSVVSDPESKALRTGQRVTRLALATSHAWQDATTKTKREAIDFHDVIAWGKLGDIIQQYVKKGSKLYIEGRLRHRSAVGKDGARRTTTEVVADNMIVLGHRTVSRVGGTPSNPRLVREDVDIDDVGDRGEA